MQGYFAIDDVDIRDIYCGTTPSIAAMNNSLTTPGPTTRPQASTQSSLIKKISNENRLNLFYSSNNLRLYIRSRFLFMDTSYRCSSQLDS